MEMVHLLNYKFEIFPTKPQRQQLNRILKEAKIQWNKGVTIWKKLRIALNTGQIDYVVRTCLSAGQEKSDTNYQRIPKFGSLFTSSLKSLFLRMLDWEMA